MSTQPQQRQYPTFSLGTAYRIDDVSVVTELAHLSEHIEGDLRNYTDRATQHSGVLRLEVTDAYPSRQIELDDGQYTPPVDDWDTARITITTTPSETESPDEIPSDLELTLLTDRADLEHTLERFTVTNITRRP